MDTFIPSCWVASYPAVGYRPTQQLGMGGLIRWGRYDPAAGYKSIHSLGTKQAIETNKKDYLLATLELLASNPKFIRSSSYR